MIMSVYVFQNLCFKPFKYELLDYQKLLDCLHPFNTSGFSGATWLWLTKTGKEITQVYGSKNIAVRLARTLKKGRLFHVLN